MKQIKYASSDIMAHMNSIETHSLFVGGNRCYDHHQMLNKPSTGNVHSGNLDTVSLRWIRVAINENESTPTNKNINFHLISAFFSLSLSLFHFSLIVIFLAVVLH